MTFLVPIFFVVYSVDVMDCHKAPRAREKSDEIPESPPVAQNSQPSSAPTLPEDRAVIILIPVRLGGERTNPEYFDFAKVRDTMLSLIFKDL